jgi:hypothetical protein
MGLRGDYAPHFYSEGAQFKISAGGVSGFPQSLQASAGAVPRLGHDRLLPNQHSSIIHPFNAI